MKTFLIVLCFSTVALADPSAVVTKDGGDWSSRGSLSEMHVLPDSLSFSVSEKGACRIYANEILHDAKIRPFCKMSEDGIVVAFVKNELTSKDVVSLAEVPDGSIIDVRFVSENTVAQRTSASIAEPKPSPPGGGCLSSGPSLWMIPFLFIFLRKEILC